MSQSDTPPLKHPYSQPLNSSVRTQAPFQTAENTPASGNGAASSGSPLRSTEAFEAYCSQVQNRLAEFAAQRQEFLQAAHDRLTRMLHAARDIGDQTLYAELW